MGRFVGAADVVFDGVGDAPAEAEFHVVVELIAPLDEAAFHVGAVVIFVAVVAGDVARAEGADTRTGCRGSGCSGRRLVGAKFSIWELW